MSQAGYIYAIGAVGTPYVKIGSTQTSVVYGTKPLEGFRQPGQIVIHTMNAAGEMTGFDIRYPTEEEAAAVERARHMRDLGLAQLQQERARKAGLPLQHHGN